MRQNNIAGEHIYFVEKEAVNKLVDCFKVNKYQSVDENILYIGMKIYDILEKPNHIDVVFEKYAKDNDLELSINLERLLYLAITFLFSIGMIEIKDKLVRRIK